MRYLLITHNANNLGDVAIAEATIQHIKSFDPNAHIVLESNNPKLSGAHFPSVDIFMRYFVTDGVSLSSSMNSAQFYVSNLRVILRLLVKSILLWVTSRAFWTLRRPRLLAEAAKADYVLSIAGDSISERYAYQLRCIEINCISDLNTNIVLYAQSIGPFKSPLAKRLIKRSLSRVRLILARDEKTSSLMKDYGVSAPIQVSADSVISLEMHKSSRVDELRVLQKRGAEPLIGMVMRTKKLSGLSAEQYSVYQKNMASLLVELQSMHSQVVMTGTIPEDFKAAEELIRMSGTDAPILKLTDFMPSEAKYVLSKFDLIMSPRMHPVILATTVGTPALALTQEFKLVEYMRNIGLDKYAISLSELDEAQARKSMDSALKELTTARSLIARHLPNLKLLSLSNAIALERLAFEDRAASE